MQIKTSTDYNFHVTLTIAPKASISVIIEYCRT